jgi:hypothetical protein
MIVGKDEHAGGRKDELGFASSGVVEWIRGCGGSEVS